MSQLPPVITVDGPGGTGKGTVSRILAKRLGWTFLDSGALYRVLAIAAEQRAFDLADEEGLSIVARQLDIQFVVEDAESVEQILLEGENVTELLRTETIGQAASKAAVLPLVREALLERQRAFRKAPGLIADGRDMGTIVFPDAQVKVFLQASCEERAKRRFLQLKGKGINANLDSILKELAERDKRDKARKVAPLKPAEDAITIDTTQLSIDKVVSRVLDEVETRIPLALQAGR